MNKITSTSGISSNCQLYLCLYLCLCLSAVPVCLSVSLPMSCARARASVPVPDTATDSAMNFLAKYITCGSLSVGHLASITRTMQRPVIEWYYRPSRIDPELQYLKIRIITCSLKKQTRKITRDLNSL